MIVIKTSEESSAVPAAQTRKAAAEAATSKTTGPASSLDNSVKLSNKLSTLDTSLPPTVTCLIHSRRSSLCLLRLPSSVNSQDNGDGHNPVTSYRTLIASSTSLPMREGVSPVHLVYTGKHCCFISQPGPPFSLPDGKGSSISQMHSSLRLGLRIIPPVILSQSNSSLLSPSIATTAAYCIFTQ